MRCTTCDSLNATTDDEYTEIALCENCNRLYQAYALRPDMWFKLARIIGPNTYLLHDDFYDDDGMPMQPGIEIDELEYKKYAIDRSTFHETAKGLMDDLLTRYLLWPDEPITIPSEFSNETRDTIESIIADSPVEDFVSKCYLIARWHPDAHWSQQVIRQYWQRDYHVHWREISCAAIFCLPYAESYQMISDALYRFDGKGYQNKLRVLSDYGTNCVLPLFRKLILSKSPPLTSGLSAIYRALNPTWQEIAGDISTDRPLSLVAIDALWIETNPGYKWFFSRKRLKPIVPPVSDLKEVLDQYLKRDNAPRVKSSINSILKIYA